MDRASELEQWQRDQALARARQQAISPSFAPAKRGKRLCRDCHDPIDKRRLSARPDAVRCTECQSYHDKETAR